MCDSWRRYAREAGFSGIRFISRYDPYKDVSGFDSLFNYEPQFSGWLNIGFFGRVLNKLAFIRDKVKLKIYSYDKICRKILRFAKKHPEMYYGCFVGYDDTPRRGERGKVVLGGTAEKFAAYLKTLYDLSCSREKEFLFLTAWNEWGEGAYLEPDEDDGTAYLDAVRHVIFKEETT